MRRMAFRLFQVIPKAFVGLGRSRRGPGALPLLVAIIGSSNLSLFRDDK